MTIRRGHSHEYNPQRATSIHRRRKGETPFAPEPGGGTTAAADCDRLVRGTWIIVFLEGGWWSALLAFERMVIVERVQSRVRRI